MECDPGKQSSKPDNGPDCQHHTPIKHTGEPQAFALLFPSHSAGMARVRRAGCPVPTCAAAARSVRRRTFVIVRTFRCFGGPPAPFDRRGGAIVRREPYFKRGTFGECVATLAHPCSRRYARAPNPAASLRPAMHGD